MVNNFGEIYNLDDEKKIKFFNSAKFGQARTVFNDDGSISINAEDTAIGFGWYEEKGNKKYPRWRTINAYIHDLGFSQEVAKDDYIPEGLFYLLGMKANNETAARFQKWLAIEVLPALRKTGLYKVSNLSPEIRAIFAIDKRTVQMSERVEKLENTMTIDYNQQEELRNLVIKKVIAVLGGKDAPAYRELSKKAFSSIWRDYKQMLNISGSYKNTLAKDFESAKHIIIGWNPERDLELMIKGANLGAF